MTVGASGPCLLDFLNFRPPYACLPRPHSSAIHPGTAYTVQTLIFSTTRSDAAGKSEFSTTLSVSATEPLSSLSCTAQGIPQQEAKTFRQVPLPSIWTTRNGGAPSDRASTRQSLNRRGRPDSTGALAHHRHGAPRPSATEAPCPKTMRVRPAPRPRHQSIPLLPQV